MLSHDSSLQYGPTTKMHNVYTDLTKTMDKYLVPHIYLLAYLKHIRGKQTRLIARGVAMIACPPTTAPFPKMDGDNSFMCHRSFMECSFTTKKNPISIDIAQM